MAIGGDVGPFGAGSTNPMARTPDAINEAQATLTK
jgi:hypothetical protein